MPFCHAELRTPKPKSDRYPKELKTLGDHIRARRIDLNLIQSQVAAQIGVHEQTVTNWESNASQPAIQYLPAIIQFIGYDPLPMGTSMIERLIAARRICGMSQREMAERLGIDPSTLQGWESGKHQPSRKMLQMITTASGMDGMTPRS